MARIDIITGMAELDEDLVVEGVKERLAAGVPAGEILGELQQGMEQVGKLYEAGEYYLSELILSGDVFSTAASLLEAALTAGGHSKNFGIVVLGTVKDDIHDIGKNIVATILSCNGFKVVDVGVDASISTFVEAVKAHGPKVVGLCCLLTTALDSMKKTVTAIKETDASIKVLVGGSPVDEKVARYCGADGYCKNAYDAVKHTRKFVGVN
ncbi:MAG: cobalamin-dependent protein [Negativicutes bacterium]|nr:cobalamin-dependent protein [Negativicutes bacterium]